MAISGLRGWQTEKREIASQARTARFVIARNEAISGLRGWQTEKREIASQARNDKDSCHREERCDLGFTGLANREKRDCHAALAFLSSRGTKRSRLPAANKQRKERLPRYARLLVIARYEAISVVQGWQTEKREIASQACNDRIIVIANVGFCHRERSVAILGLRSWQTEKERLLRRLAMTTGQRSRSSGDGKQRKERLLRRLAMTATHSALLALLSSRGTKRSRVYGAGKQPKERLPRFTRNPQRGR